MALSYSNVPRRGRQNGKQCRPWSDCSLTWGYIVYPGLSVQILRIITVSGVHENLEAHFKFTKYFLFIVTQTFWVFSQYLPCILHHILKYFVIHIWAATWQNQQNECAPTEDSDQPGHPPILIGLRCPHEESFGPKLPIKPAAKTLFRLGRCPGWSESSLSSHYFCWVLSCCGSFHIFQGIMLVYDITNEPHHDKTCFYHIRTITAQISLHIGAVWSAPLLYTAWIV